MKNKTIRLITVVTAIAILSAPCMLPAEEIKIKKIEPVSGFNTRKIDYGELAKRNFGVIGKVDAIYETYVVVNDHVCKLEDYSDISGISRGMTVGVRINGNGKVVEIKRLSPSIFKKK